MSFILSVAYAECIYAICHLCFKSFMLNGVYSVSFMLCMLRVIYAVQFCRVLFMLSAAFAEWHLCYVAYAECQSCRLTPVLFWVPLRLRSENTKRGSITVPLTSCMTGLDWSVLQIKTNWQLSYSWFQTGGQWYSDTPPFSIPCLGQWAIPMYPGIEPSLAKPVIGRTYFSSITAAARPAL